MPDGCADKPQAPLHPPRWSPVTPSPGTFFSCCRDSADPLGRGIGGFRSIWPRCPTAIPAASAERFVWSAVLWPSAVARDERTDRPRPHPTVSECGLPMNIARMMPALTSPSGQTADNYVYGCVQGHELIKRVERNERARIRNAYPAPFPVVPGYERGFGPGVIPKPSGVSPTGCASGDAASSGRGFLTARPAGAICDEGRPPPRAALLVSASKDGATGLLSIQAAYKGPADKATS